MQVSFKESFRKGDSISMDEKEVFDLMDNISEEELIDSFEKLNVEHAIEDNIDNETKERIRKRLHKKIEENTDEFKLKDSKNDKKQYKVVKNKYLKTIIGTIAAMIIFVVLVNISPKFAYALENIPGVDRLIRLIKFSEAYDKSLKTIIDEGRYQKIDKTVKDKGAKFTVNTIAGDGLKLWIDYDFKGKGLFIQQIWIKDANSGKILNCYVGHFTEGDLMSIDRTFDSNEFNIEVEVYKDREEFHNPMSSYTEEELEEMGELFEKSKVATLVVPIKLDENIFGEDSFNEYLLNRNISTGIGDFTLEKLETSPSRTKVYLKLNNEGYSNIFLENLRIEDSESNIYYEINNHSYSKDTLNKGFPIQLEGGLKDINNIKLKCDKISYVDSEQKYITVDLNKKVVEDNIYGITLNDIQGNTISINVPNGMIELGLPEEIIRNFRRGRSDPQNGIEIYTFNKFNSDKVVFEVLSYKENKVEGFEVDIK